ncbi:MAG: sugar ABC transporter permease [Chloroflexi bacterium]|nr:sugar ABC transporter permease [Chloroflexota bacterium]TDI86802.1 MAG: sugar ABC transporter permease [Chloroflexota bacterium]
MSEVTYAASGRPPSTVISLRPSRWKKVYPAIEGYLYLAPTLIALSIFIFLPVYNSFILSLNRIAPFGNQKIYVGFDNFARLFADPQYWNSIKVTFLFVLGTVPTGIFLAVLLAIALSYPLRHLSGLHRLMIFVPVVISSAIAGVLFRWLYNPVVGYFNYWISLVGLEGQDWLTSKQWALSAVILATIWKEFGFNVIIALAGVQNIDNSYYDAAKVDGANVWQRIRHITLPLLTPTLFFLLIINVIQNMEAFGQIHVLTEGGPGQATTNLVYSIYFDAFVGTPQRGIASAQAYILALIVIAVSFVQYRGLGKRVHYQ